MSLRARVSELGMRLLNKTARNHEYRLVPKPGPRAGQLFEQGPLWTKANHDFVEDPAFQRAYQRGVQAAGWDFHIEWRIHVVLWAAAAAARVPGDFVDCGVGRGMVSSAVLQSLDWERLQRPDLLISKSQPPTCDSDKAVKQSMG